MNATSQPRNGANASSQRRRLRTGLVTAAVLSMLLGGLQLAIPGLGAVCHHVGGAR
ncbi:MAG: hypothetical protein ACLPTJ_16375 [Solirubrobacteraceae bacterium]